MSRQSGTGRTEALALVRQVREELAGVENTGDLIPQIDTWLAEKGHAGGT